MPSTNAAGAGVPGPAFFHDLLVKTSRTFALSIPALAEPLRTEVGLAYLLFRIADTFEDAHTWPAAQRAARLEEFACLVADCDVESTRRAATGWLAEHPTQHAGYRELLAASADVLAEYATLPAAARRTIGDHVARTCQGMARFVAKAGGGNRLQLRDVAELREYCYVVAGIVGELLTELFVLHETALATRPDFFRSRAALFGEALQLVNILKDSALDAREGRIFLPPGEDRGKVFALARADLGDAAAYVLALQEVGAQRGIVAFTALPLLLARETLDRLETSGPGAKVSRERVLELAGTLEERLASGGRAV